MNKEIKVNLQNGIFMDMDLLNFNVLTNYSTAILDFKFLLYNYVKKVQINKVTVKQSVIPREVRIRPFALSLILIWSSTSFK